MARSSRAMTCPACRRLIAGDEPRCPFCGEKFGVTWSLDRLTHRLLGRLDFTKGVMGACAVIYGLMLALDALGGVRKTGALAAANPSYGALFVFGLQDTWMIVRGGQWWRLLTSVFIHLSLIHLAFNLLALRFIGPVVEEIYGRGRYVLVYVLSGLTGSIASLAFHIDGAGASGALFGLIGATALYAHLRGGAAGAALRNQMLLWAVYGLVFGFVVGANNVAHLAGMAGGAASGYALGRGPRRLRDLSNILAGIAVAAVAGAFAFVAIDLPASRRYLHMGEVRTLSRVMHRVEAWSGAVERAAREGVALPPHVVDAIRAAWSDLRWMDGPDERSDAARRGVLAALRRLTDARPDDGVVRDLRRHLDAYLEWEREEGPRYGLFFEDEAGPTRGMARVASSRSSRAARRMRGPAAGPTDMDSS